MGRKGDRIEVRLRLSDHNSEQDDEDAKLARELADRIREVANEPRYADILDAVDDSTASSEKEGEPPGGHRSDHHRPVRRARYDTIWTAWPAK